jgi:hypothetical protein
MMVYVYGIFEYGMHVTQLVLRADTKHGHPTYLGVLWCWRRRRFLNFGGLDFGFFWAGRSPRSLNKRRPALLQPIYVTIGTLSVE